MTDARADAARNKVGAPGPEGKAEPARNRPPPTLEHPTLEHWDIRIARDGTWFHEGAPIRRPALVRLFATVLTRDENGEFWLITPVERGRVVVEDAPFLAVEMIAGDSEDKKILKFRTNIDEWVAAGPDHPIRVVEDPRTGEPSPYILIRPGLEARMTRAVFYELVERGEPNPARAEGEIGVWSKGVFFSLGRLPPDA